VGYKIAAKEPPSDAEAAQGKALFANEMVARPTPRRDRRGDLNKEVTKIRINIGKKKNMRPGDILGALTGIECVSASDIGIVDVQDHFSYVDILDNKGSLVMEAL